MNCIYTLGVSLIPSAYIKAIVDINSIVIYRVDGWKIVVIKDKIVKELIRTWVDDSKKVLTGTSSDRMTDADDNANNLDLVLISRVNGSIELVSDGKILKVLTKTGIGDTKEILTETLPNRVEDVDDIVTSQRSRG